MELSKYLKDNNISMREFASMVGCSPGFISLICSRKRRPAPDLAMKIERAAGGTVTLRELLFPELFD
jgi:transcriptional regulator with XRE-family HTH domain